jgi:DNA-binding MarR family transcriptional regulator
MPDDRWENALSRVLELTLLLGRDATENLARMGLTEARAHLLWELRTLAPCPQRELATALRVTPRAVTALVDGLAETGFVTREPCPTDRRATLVTLTEQGHTTTQVMVEGFRNLARQLFTDMPAGVFDGFDDGLTHVIGRLRTLLTESARGGS